LKLDDLWGPFQPRPFYDSMHLVGLMLQTTLGMAADVRKLVVFILLKLLSSLFCLHSCWANNSRSTEFLLVKGDAYYEMTEFDLQEFKRFKSADPYNKNCTTEDQIHQLVRWFHV